MTSYRFKVGDAFPVDDVVARFLLTASLGYNDLVLVNRWFLERPEDDAAGHSYLFRLTCMHLWEFARFIEREYERWPPVREHIDGLPENARACFGRLCALVDEDSADSIASVLAQTRHLVAHYQEMNPERAPRPRDPITRALTEIQSEEVTLLIPELVKDLRLAHADAVMARAALRLWGDRAPELLDRIAGSVGDCIVFMREALDAHVRSLAPGLVTEVV